MNDTIQRNKKDDSDSIISEIGGLEQQLGWVQKKEIDYL